MMDILLKRSLQRLGRCAAGDMPDVFIEHELVITIHRFGALRILRAIVKAYFFWYTVDLRRREL